MADTVFEHNEHELGSERLVVAMGALVRINRTGRESFHGKLWVTRIETILEQLRQGTTAPDTP